MTALTARLEVRRDAFALALDLAARDGEVLALVGPNGAGKSTAVAALAGLVPLDGGHVRVGDRMLDDATSGVHLPAEQRRVGVLFQDYLLFPHLDALENVAFGLRSAGVGRREARERASGWLERFEVSDLAHRRPAELSGGQAQRVALARTLAARPEVLLLDEPLAALDVEVRDSVRAELGGLLAAFDGPTVLVTHALDDVEALAQRVIVLERGAATHEGTVAELLEAPRTPYACRLVASRGSGAP